MLTFEYLCTNISDNACYCSGVGIVLGLLAVYIISKQAKKEFNKIVSLQEQETPLEDDDNIVYTPSDVSPYHTSINETV